MWLLALAILLILPLTACEKKPPDAPPTLPRVERPVLALDVKQENLMKLLIPHQALVQRGGIPGVFVLGTTGEARFRLIRAGRTRGSQVEILSGLHGTETLVLGDLSAIHDGTPVTVVAR